MNQHLSPQELARIAESLRLTGQLLESHGFRALTVTESWQQGPRSANLDPDSGGWRYDEAGEPIPNDTTGEAAVSGDDSYKVTPDRFVKLVNTLDSLGEHLRDVIYSAAPQATLPNVFEPDTPAQISAAGWCVSCHRDGGYCEPVSMRPDGTRRYRDYCTWCGEFIATQERNRGGGKRKRKKDSVALPPIELVRARHRGDRITKQMVDHAVRKAS